MNQPDQLLYRQFQQVFTQHYNGLCNYAHSFLRDADASEDIVQEVFTRIWEKRQDLIGREAIRYYLFTAVRNNCLTHLQRNKKSGMVALADQDGSEMPAALAAGAPATDFRQLLQQGLAALPPKCREAFLLSRIGLLTYQEIAAQLGISVKTVENQIGKALRLLRAFAEKQKVDSAAIFLLLFLNQTFLT